MGSLKIKIREVPEKGLEIRTEAQRLLSASEPGLPPMGTDELGLDFVGPIRIAARVRVVGETVLVGGSVKADLKARCDRCLAEFETTAGQEFELALQPASRVGVEEDGPRGREIELTPEDLDEFLYHGEEADLEPFIYEQLVLALPDVWICRPDCKGLCPRCGADLNVGPCRCEKGPADPRFAVLKNLKLK